LERFVREVFGAIGAPDDAAREAARHLVRANLSGHDPHGVIRVPQYVSQAETGELVPAAVPTILRETSVTALIDARRSFGQFSTAFALDWAMGRAEQHGMASAAVRHSAHIGRVGEYAERAAARGLVSIVTVGAAGPGVGGMLLFGGRGRFFGANPWSIGVPAEDGTLMLLDASSSAVAEGKVRVARAAGVPLPPGSIMDREGAPTTDADEFYAGGALVPLGGEAAGHKGYGLALASALIGGLAMIGDPDYTLIGASVVQATGDRTGQIAGVFLVVIDPSSFGDAAHFRAMVGATPAAAKRMPPGPGVEEVLVPGEPESRARERRGREGIALPEATWEELEAVGTGLGVTPPEHRPA